MAQAIIALPWDEHGIAHGRAAGAFGSAGFQRLMARHAVCKEARGRSLLVALELQPSVQLFVGSANHAPPAR